MEGTVPVKHSKRKAREYRLSQDFQALADFANLGDTLKELQKFRVKQPTFFPDDLGEWVYRSTENWMIRSTIPDAPGKDLRQILLSRFDLNPDDYKNWPEVAQLYRDEGWDTPPLFFYRALVRAVWRRSDPDGSYLKYLLGFEEDGPPPIEGVNDLWIHGLA